MPDGNIEFLGRIDRQVKIRGHRVELGEIESYLRDHEGVKEAHVMIYDDQVLASVVSATENEQPAELKDLDQLESALRTHCSEGLPSYMQPTVYSFVEKMPLNLSDKVDEKALIELYESMDSSQEQQEGVFEPCEGELELALAEIWSIILGRDQIGRNEDFFEIGGHSLLAMRVKSQIVKELEVELDIRDLFIHKTIAGLASYIEEKGKGRRLPAVSKMAERPERIPTSYAQERLWFIDQFQGSVQYHMPVVFSCYGDLDVSLLEDCFRSIMSRHETLRTVVKEADGQTYQEILGVADWQLNYHEQSTAELIDQLISTPYDLSADYMLRADLLKVAEGHHHLVLVIHHIAGDGWSESVFVRELVELYQSKIENRTANLSPISIQYADYSIWQRTHLSGAVLEEKLAYWTEQLKGVSALNMPTDFVRPSIQSTNGSFRSFSIGKELKTALEAYAKEEGVTMYMLLLSVFKVLLYRYSGQEDICVGSPTANRDQEELEGLIGFFVNSLALRSDLSNDPSFKDLLQQVKQTTMAAYAHQEVPFEQIVDRVEQGRDLSRSPIYQMVFVMQNTPEVPDLKLGNLELKGVEFEHQTSLYDMTFNVNEGCRRARNRNRVLRRLIQSRDDRSSDGTL